MSYTAGLNYHRSLFTVMLCFLLTKAMAQHVYSDERKQREFTVEDGLPDNLVRCLVTDNQGFLWIGTHGGLSRYDGNTFTNFYAEPEDTTALCGNIIVDLSKDDKGRIWISTEENGLCVLDPVRMQFSRYTIGNKGYGYLPGKNPSGMMQDRKGNVWVPLFGKGLARLNTSSNSFELVRIDPDTQAYNHNEMREGVMDKAGNFWLASRKGLVFFNPEKQLIRFYDQAASSKEEEIAKNLLTCVALDKDGNILAGTWDRGLMKYIVRENRWEQYLLDKNIAESRNRINDIQIDSDNKLYLSTSAYGVIHCSGNLSSLEACALRQEDTGVAMISLKSGQTTFEGYTDRLVRSNDLSSTLQYFSSNRKVTELDGFATVSSITRFNDSLVLLGSYYRKGLFAFKLPDNSFRRIQVLAGKEDRHVFDIEKDHNRTNGYWLGTLDGIAYFDASTSTVTASPILNDTGARPLMIYDVYQHSDDAVWICGKSFLRSSGLSGPTIDHFERIRPLSDRRRQTFYGITVYDERTLVTWTDEGEVFLVGMDQRGAYTYNKIKLPELHARVMQVVVDRQKRIWIGLHSNGVTVYNPADESTRHFTNSAGLFGSMFRSMLLDKEENLWVLSQQGLSMIHTPSGKAISFQYKIPSLLEDPNILTEINDSLLLIGGFEEFAVLNKHKLLDENLLNKVILTAFLVNEEKEFSSYFSEGNSTLMLQHEENTISVSFTLPDPAGLSLYEFEYRLEGLDEDWINIGRDRKIRLANLAPGSYILHLRARVTTSGSSSPVTILRFSIRPPYYQTWWFISLLVTVLVSGAYWGVRYRERIIRRKEQEKKNIRQQMAELENQALKSRMNPHFIFNCLNSINGFILKNNKDTAIQFINKFAKLIRYILEKSGEKEISLEEELIALKNYIEIEAIRLSQSFTYSIDISPAIDPQKIRIPPLLIQPLVENAIWHGLHVEEKLGLIRIKIKEEGEFIRVDVEDNGIGYSKSLANKETRKYEKRSLGLSITRQRLEILLPKGKHGEDLLSIRDRYTDDGLQEGTVSTLLIPHYLHHE